MRQLVMSHVGTDFDGLASMVLAQKLYHGSQLVFPGRLSAPVKEFYDLHKRRFPALALKEALAERPDRIIVVDTRTPSRLGDFRQWVHDSEIELHIYDHHPPTAESVRGDQEWVEPVGAAATLLVERCRLESLTISQEEASLALIAIHEETGSFRYSSTTSRDLEAAAYLLERGANLDVVTEFLRDPLTDAQRHLLEEFLQTGRVAEGSGGRLFVSHAKRARSVYGLGGLASRMLELQNTDAVCAILEVEGEGSTIAARAANDLFDMAECMARWGGGGHRRAASASKLSESGESLAEQLVEIFSKGTVCTLTAGDLMSRELFTVELTVSVENAYKELLARGYQSACVVDQEGALHGLVSRSDLIRALDHHLGHAPAKSVMTHKVVSVQVSDTLEQVRRVVVERNVGSLPVMQQGELVGIVTRSDLLRELYHHNDEEAWGSGSTAILSLNRLAEPNLTRLRQVARKATERQLRVYVVGGFVRDLFLERPSDDLDLVVEGDAIELARELQKELGGKLVAHEKYLTACLKFGPRDKLDIATARREVYVRPAALPEVAESKLKSDLFRRDFTINALALRLNEQLECLVIDFFGGRQDLESKKIRVLHNHSFLDDPTRILRAVRFEQRLGFLIEPHTKQLISSALEAQVFQLAHAERMAEEFRLSLSERDPVKVLDRLENLKVLQSIHPDLHFRQKPRERVQRAQEFMQSNPAVVPHEDRWRVPLLVLALELSAQAKEEIRARFGWDLARWPISIQDALAKLCRRPLKPSEVADIFDSLLPTQIALLAAIANNEKFYRRLEHYLRQTRGLVPLLTGHEIMQLGVAPGPQVAEWKRRAYAAQRNEEFSDLEGAVRWFQDEVGQPASR